MNIQQITSSQNFKGKLVVVNKLSQKPQRCVNKIFDSVQELINKKDYNLYLRQDYAQNSIGISAEYPFPIKPHQRVSYGKFEKNIPAQSKAAMYKKTAEDVVKAFEENKLQKEQKKWEQKQKQRKKEELLDYARSLLYAPFYIAEYILYDINPKWAKKFEKFIDKIEI